MSGILFKIMNKYTSLSEEEQQAIVNNIPIEEYKKGTVLLKMLFRIEGLHKTVRH